MRLWFINDSREETAIIEVEALSLLKVDEVDVLAFQKRDGKRKYVIPVKPIDLEEILEKGYGKVFYTGKLEDIE